MKLTVYSVCFLFVCFLFPAVSVSGQQTNKSVKIKPGLFKGRWQLVQTYSLGSLHQVKKDEYDGIICFRSFHRYFEEVNYESNHWVIEGKWHINCKTKKLELTQRKYTQGKLEEHPADITFDIIKSGKNEWAGSMTDKGQLAKVYYSRI